MVQLIIIYILLFIVSGSGFNSRSVSQTKGRVLIWENSWFSYFEMKEV